MPRADKYYPPTSSDRYAGDITESERQERARKYELAQRYYEGDQRKTYSVEVGQPDDNVIYNLVKMTADRTVTFLFPDEPRYELNDASIDETEDERWLRDAWEHSGGLSLYHQMGYTGFLSGHVFCRVLPPQREGEYPRVVVLNPSLVTTFWRHDDVHEVVWYEMKWLDNSGHTHIIDFVHRPSVETRIAVSPSNPDAEEYDQIISWKQVNDDGTMEEKFYAVTTSEPYWEIFEYTSNSSLGSASAGYVQVGYQRWDSPLSPIVDWQHLPNPNKRYGLSEVSNIQLQDTVNNMYSAMGRIIRYYAHPRTIAIGISPEDIVQTGVDMLWAIENSDAKIMNLEMQSELIAAQAIATTMVDTYLSEARVVRLKGEVKDFQRVTNTGVQTVFQEALSKNKSLTKNYYRGLQELSMRMQMLAGHPVKRPIVVGVDPLPSDDKERIDVLAIERSMGAVSRQSISEKRGYNWRVEYERQAKEALDPVFNPVQATKQDEVRGVDDTTPEIDVPDSVKPPLDKDKQLE